MYIITFNQLKWSVEKIMKEDKFLTNIMKRKCGIANFSQSMGKQELNDFEFAYAKTDISTKNAIIAHSNNFYLAETSIIFVKKLEETDYRKAVHKNLIIKDSKFSDEVVAIARESFVHDRFNEDPNISNSIASEIKAQWVMNFYRGLRGDACFVAKTKCNVVKGFLITLEKPNEVIIDLIAVDARYKNQHVASNLIHHMFEFYKKKVKQVTVSTQLVNTAGCALYRKLGFNTLAYQNVWHHHKNFRCF